MPRSDFDACPMVAVGKRVTPLPPHRSRRALLTHRAPPSGSGVEAVTGHGMYNPDRRKETIDETSELFPVDVCPLTAARERPPPQGFNPGEEPGHTAGVQRDGVVVQVPGEHLVEPCPRPRNGIMPASA